MSAERACPDCEAIAEMLCEKDTHGNSYLGEHIGGYGPRAARWVRMACAHTVKAENAGRPESSRERAQSPREGEAGPNASETGRENRQPEGDDPAGAARAPTYTCDVCEDTHLMWFHDFSGDSRQVMCTHCPSPCPHCRGRLSPYCATTPCSCECHAAWLP